MKRSAEIALTNRLYVNQWELRNVYKSVIEGNEDYKIILKKKNGEYVGSAVLYTPTNLLMVFVKSRYRRQGIGKELIERILNKYRLSRSSVEARYGNTCSKKFWETINIKWFY